MWASKHKCNLAQPILAIKSAMPGGQYIGLKNKAQIIKAELRPDSLTAIPKPLWVDLSTKSLEKNANLMDKSNC